MGQSIIREHITLVGSLFSFPVRLLVSREGWTSPSYLRYLWTDLRCCTTLSAYDSHRESKWLDGPHGQAVTRPLSQDELFQLHCIAAQARIAADLAGQGDDLARAA